MLNPNVEEDKKELVRDVHTLAHMGVRLVDSVNDKIIIKNGLKSSLVMDVCLNCTR